MSPVKELTVELIKRQIYLGHMQKNKKMDMVIVCAVV